MNKLIILLAAVMMLACNSQTKSDTNAAKEDVVSAQEWVEVVLNVEGMTCEGCENAIKAGVETLPGIEEVESSHVEAFTRVKFDKNRTSLEEITEKITETGYVVKGEI